MDMGVDPRKSTRKIVLVLIIFIVGGVNGVTNLNDFKILKIFRNGLQNPDLLRWPEKGDDPCGPPAWPHVVCSNGRVTEIQVQGLGLKGQLPQNLNQLDKLREIGFQKNYFTGNLPSLSGLSNLKYAFLGFNKFETITDDVFRGLRSLRVLAFDSNPFNQSSGWSIPNDLAESTQLVNFSCSNCNIVGKIPDFFGRISTMNSLRLSSNRLSGEIPSSFHDSPLRTLLLNDQQGVGLTGSIGVIATMVLLTRVWLHGNQLTGPIPDNIGNLLSLRELNLNRNRLFGLVPAGLANLNLQVLDLDDNMLTGPIPIFKAVKVSYDSNSFCQSVPDLQCAPEVSALLRFLHDVNYPEMLALEWKGNDPCAGPWWGISCNSGNHVSVIKLRNLGLDGTLSSSLEDLPALVEIQIQGNNLHGVVPNELTLLKSLKLLNITGNKFDLPLPRFRSDVKVEFDYRIAVADTVRLPPPQIDTPGPSRSPNPPVGGGGASRIPNPPVGGGGASRSPNPPVGGGATPPAVNSNQNSTKSRVKVIVASVAVSVIFTLLAVLLAFISLKKRKETKKARAHLVIHPKGSLANSSILRISKVVASALKAQIGSGMRSRETNGSDNAGSLVFSLKELREVTNNFSQENELGRGGFGVVYRGKLGDGRNLAVKRMEAGVISDKAVNEFQTEIAVLSTVRHRNLVSLLGYSVGGNERLLVYEYMPQGALSQHLFHWKNLNLQPLPWKKRLNIALDVARGVEYLHTLAHHSFIHRDLKSSNILLDDDFRAKVSDFGLVKLALDKEHSVATQLAGTFGYLAPEYACTGKITTKVDVFSFGVVLMELLTGLVAVDERRPEEKQYLVEWFWKINSNRETLITSIDAALDAREDIHDSICAMAELAGHCTVRDPSHRADMGYAVSVLSRLVETWRPHGEMNRCSGNELILSLPQLVEGWKEEDMRGGNASIPSGFADSFSSGDAR